MSTWCIGKCDIPIGKRCTWQVNRGLMGLDGTRAEPLVVLLTTRGRNVTIPAGGGYENLPFIFPRRNSP